MTSTLWFSEFPGEIVSDILSSCDSLQDLLSFSTTCRRFQSVYRARKVQYLSRVVEEQYGPMHDAIQLVTYNASQAAHVTRRPALSEALLQQVITYGRVAATWEDIYPSKHWHDNFEYRRLLSAEERRALRRAVYRLWLYDVAFHNNSVTRLVRMSPQYIRERTLLLHNWDNKSLAEIANVHAVVREVLKSNICPSNGAIERKFRKRFPSSNHQLMFNIHLNYPSPPTLPSARFAGNARFGKDEGTRPAHVAAEYRNYGRFRPTTNHDPGFEGWGDDIDHYYVVEDMLKLNPQQVLWLKDNAPSKGEVEGYVKHLGEWFENNGETFEQTLDVVLAQRGVDARDFRDAVADGQFGIATVDEHNN